ncbi:unnamed protein product [Victoria cruziana]
MAAGAGLSPPLTVLESGYGRDNGAFVEDSSSEHQEIMRQPKAGKPPRCLSTIRHCVSTARLASSEDLDADVGSVKLKPLSDEKSSVLPIFRSGSYSEIGPKPYMEDEHICIDNLVEHIGTAAHFPSSSAFYGVFDGHGGSDAAAFVQKNILRFIIEDAEFPTYIDKAIRSAFLRADDALANTCSLDSTSGTTALTALAYGRTLLVANAGDCRAVLGKRGKAVELSRDHKPNCSIERKRIESLEPELQKATLTDEDEFLIMGCDGLWDVMSSQCAVTIARRELMVHNDPERCSRELVREALKRNTCDNLTVVIVCFSADPPPRIEVPKSRVRRSISAEGLNSLREVLDSYN